MLLVCCAGIFNLQEGLTQSNGFREQVESLEGQALLAKSFPSGGSAPADIVVPDPARAAAVQAAVARTKGVAGVRPAGRGAPGVLLEATLTEDPYGAAAFDLIPPIRAAARRAGGPGVLVGGQTAIALDGADASGRDTRLIVPMALVVVFLILMVLLRAVAAPLLLIGTVILSFGASLGISAVAYDVIFGFPKSDPSLPLYTFVFLVALGIDYNIFLMARVREETVRHGTRAAMVRALAVTGGGDHLRRHRARRHVLGARDPAAGVPAADRLRDRLRRPARHADRALGARARARARHRAPDLVAVAARSRERER